MARPATPLEFRYPASTFWLTTASGLLLCGLFIAAAVWAYSDPDLHADWLWVLIAAVVMASYAYAILSVKLSSIRLYPDRIEHHALFRHRAMPLADVAGWRSAENGDIQLEARDGKRCFPLPKALVRDPRWQGWLNGLTSLDDVDANAQFHAVEGDAAFGNSPTQRVQTANRVKRAAALTVWPWLAILIWGFVYPRPYVWAMAATAALPVIALAVTWRWKDLFTLDEAEAKQGGKGDLSHLLLWSGPVLALRAMIDLHMLDWTGPLIVAVLGAALAGIAAVRLHQYSRLATVWLFVSLFAWAGGGALIANQQLDSSPAATVRATVLKTSVDGDDGVSVTVRTDGAEPRRISNLDVFGPSARTLRPGSVICVDIHPGRFGWRYAYATACPAA